MSALDAALLQPLFSGRVIAVTALAEGANSRVYRVTLDDGRDRVVKHYAPSEPDRADRLQVEFKALSFLTAHGVHDLVAHPLARDLERRLCAYTMLRGRPLQAAEISADDVSQCVGFLARLQRLGTIEEASELGPASEACFTLNEHLTLLRQRMSVLLRELSATDPLHRTAATFVRDELQPFTDTLEASSQIQLSDPFPSSDRILSPSDFGFHNILKQPDGTLVFLDFEYFGWDDLAKTAADFLLQPQVPVGADLGPTFIRELERRLRPSASFRCRLEQVYPLLGVKWCLIMLNPFRRRSWRTNHPDPSTLLLTRLHAARSKFEALRAARAEGRFPLSMPAS